MEIISRIYSKNYQFGKIIEFKDDIYSDKNNFYVIISTGEDGLCICNINESNLQQNYYDQEEGFVDNMDQFQCKCFSFLFTVTGFYQINGNQLFIYGKNNIMLANLSVKTKTITSINYINESGVGHDQIDIDTNKWYLFSAANENLRIYNYQKLLNSEAGALICVKPYWEENHVLRYFEYYNQKTGVTEHLIYSLDLIRGLYITNLDTLYDGETEAVDSINPSLLQEELLILHRQINTLQFTSDGAYLLLGTRTVGINIYDISDPYEPYLYETIYTIGYASKIILINNEKQLVYCNGDYIKVYNSLQENQSLHFPNLFNKDQAVLIDIAIEHADSSAWRVKINNDGSYLFIAAARNGLLIYDLSDPNSPQFFHRIECQEEENNPTDGCQLSLDNNYLYIGEGYMGVRIFDISDMSSIQEKSVIVLGGDTDDIQNLNHNSNYIVTANGYTSVSVIDITDKSNPVEKSSWVNNSEGGSIENVLVSSDDKYVYASLRYYGLVLLELDPVDFSLTVVSEYQTGMCEMILVNSDNNIAFLSDGTYGITIIDISDKQNIKLISQLLLGGFPAKMRLVQYANKYDYLLISERDQELLAGVNITDIYNPTLDVKLQIDSQEAYDVECLNSIEYCYLATNVGLLVLPMTSSIQINNLMSEITYKNEQEIETYLDDNLLKIGKNIRVTLIPIRSGGTIKINSIKFYEDYKLVSIPSYMSFNEANLELNIEVNKNGIISGEQTKSNILQVEMVKKITYKNLVSESDPVIDETLAQNFIEKCIELGYLTSSQFISDTYSPGITLFPYETDTTLYTDSRIAYVDQVLTQSIIRIPLLLIFANSLFFNYGSMVQNEIIQTESSTLTVTINILVESESDPIAEFVEQTYVGATVHQSYFYMEGSKSSVLIMLSKSLLTMNYTDDLSEIQLSFTIDDGINHQKSYELGLDQCKFMNLHQGLKTGYSTLEEQFSLAYNDGKIFIEREMQFQFSENTMKSTADLEVAYTITIKRVGQDDTFITPDISYWLDISNEERRLVGTPTQWLYGDKIIVRVEGSDGYSTMSQEFSIYINRIPYELIIYYIIAIGR
ncbi:hypothetical protein PPERSA_09143 [Pseudocohnilembus persalinus]|uniref:Quinoprotein amine dehydrogenase, beta chain-like protein n=1 Tax=Pseudocohnilembus persalinus TaxID=266149 RepID=A0A0V0QXY2_PSEPJ|nr:hypothetical protein PPERSA_09143 [Pseudocohnilembus persalinus]|eukprot:KRX06741.1 hypothetical protein PPERSA_09143 [Pseudocohnilembus persalinus]